MTASRPPARHAVPLRARLLALAAASCCSSPDRAPLAAVDAARSPPAPAGAGLLQPTIQYEEARRPRRRPDRRSRRASGCRSPFKPRASDRWTVGGERAAGAAGRAPVRPRACASRSAAARPPRRPPSTTADAGRRAPSAGSTCRTSHPAPRVQADLAAAVDPGGLRARGVRLPAVLGADRQLDPARLGEALDDRLLRRRRGRQRRPPATQRAMARRPSAGAAGRARS